MRGNRKKDTRPELAIRAQVHRSGLRYRVARRPFVDVGTADLVFAKARVAVFVDGCYWHGCPKHFTFPRVNAEYWRTKIQVNRARDSRNDALLVAADWMPIRVWEHEDPVEAADRIVQAVRQRIASR